MITSTRNPKIQQVRALQARNRERRSAQAFVVEGVRLTEEALAAGWPAELVLYSPEVGERGQNLVAGFASRGVPVEEVSAEVFKAASDTQSPQGILAILGMRSLPLPETLTFVFIPDAVRDPGNLGTMLRTASAAGVEAVFLPSGTVDLYAPKVVRSAMGAHFRLPVYAGAWDQISQRIEQDSLSVYLAAAGEGRPYTQTDFRERVALVIGGEAEGAGQEAQALAAGRVHIPMTREVESLNAAVAAAVLLFEVARQRGNP